MAEDSVCIGGIGPLVVLQASAAAQWQGANGYGDILPNGDVVETDYDILCDGGTAEGICIVTHYERDMLGLWAGAFGARFFTPALLNLSLDILVLTMCHPDDEWPDILPLIIERVRIGKPERSLLLNVQDTMLRLQAGTDWPYPDFPFYYVDIPAVPGRKQCDIYGIDYHSFRDEFIIIKPV